MSESHIRWRLRSMVCASATLSKVGATVKSSDMKKRIVLALAGQWLIGAELIGCSDGGQTYDDGADGLGGRRTPPVVADSSEGEGSTELASTDSATPLATSGQEEPDSTPPAIPSPAPDSTEERCTQLWVQAAEQLEAAYQDMDSSCAVDTDCQLRVLPQSTCATFRFCSNESSVTAESLSALQPDVDAIDTSVCAEFDELGCPPVQPSGDCGAQVPLEPWCDAGSCASRPQRSCEEAFAGAWAGVFDVYETADRSCDVDEDCTLFASNGVVCTPGFLERCDSTIGVNAEAATSMATQLASISERECEGYEPDSCTATVPAIECPNVLAVRCIEQQCVAVADE